MRAALLPVFLTLAYGQESISVKTFGASGDGRTDDTAALQSALRAVCRERFSVTSTSGNGVSPIVVTTSAPHRLMNGSSVTVQGVAGNTAANGAWKVQVLSSTTLVLQGQQGEPTVGNGDYAQGGTLGKGGTLEETAPRLFFPAGTYNISSALVTTCPTTILGEGAGTTVIFQTHQYSSTHGIVANYSLSIEDIALNTRPLAMDLGMIAVFGGASAKAAPMAGYRYRFVRFRSEGFNFALNLNGTSETDLLDSILVENSELTVGTQPNAVSQPINAANARMLTVKNSILSGDSVNGEVRNDHAIYTLAVRGILIQGNLIRNHGNSAIKLLQGGFHNETCPTIQDYTAWTIDNNRIENSRLAVAAYSYCGLVLPSITLSNNEVRNVLNPYLGDYAAVYVQANCESNIVRVESRGNRFANLGLGGIVLASQVQADNACTAKTAQGTITEFSSTQDTFENWSTSAPGVFPAINSTGSNLLNASVSQLQAEGGQALNLSAFRQTAVAGN